MTATTPHSGESSVALDLQNKITECILTEENLRRMYRDCIDILTQYEREQLISAADQLAVLQMAYRTQLLNLNPS